MYPYTSIVESFIARVCNKVRTFVADVVRASMEEVAPGDAPGVAVAAAAAAIPRPLSWSSSSPSFFLQMPPLLRCLYLHEDDVVDCITGRIDDDNDNKDVAVVGSSIP